MRRPFAVFMASTVMTVAALIGSGTTAAASVRAEGEVQVIPFAPNVFTAELEITDTGTALIVKGQATGLDPTKTYVSLDYTTPATGPTACEPGGDLSFAQMFLGTWSVNSSGEGTLVAVKTAAGNTNQPPASLLAFLNATGVPTGGTAYHQLNSSITSVSVRRMTPVAGFPIPVPLLIGCGALNVETGS